MSSGYPSLDQFTVGWICATETESVAATQFLDLHFEDYRPVVSTHDTNDYVLGRIKDHNVVIASLPDGEQGQTPAATVARNMSHTFLNIRIGLMVGLGGGAQNEKYDIRLGDIVVSSPGEGTGGVVNYDFGIQTQGEVFQKTGHLNNPPQVVRTAVAGLKAAHVAKGNGIEDAVKLVLDKAERLAHNGYGRPDASPERTEDCLDKLFEKDVVHTGAGENCCNKKDPANVIKRKERKKYDDNPAIHYGIIGSSSEVMRDANRRDEIAKEHNIICFEREAAGLMNHFGCLIIRGINTYADSHGNSKWDGYASLTAAAYAKALLQRIPLNKVEAMARIKFSEPTGMLTGAENA